MFTNVPGTCFEMKKHTTKHERKAFGFNGGYITLLTLSLALELSKGYTKKSGHWILQITHSRFLPEYG